MKYNINKTDIGLSKHINSKDGTKMKSDLKHNISEQEKMLDIFVHSINHCNEQIQYCRDKEAN